MYVRRFIIKYLFLILIIIPLSVKASEVPFYYPGLPIVYAPVGFGFLYKTPSENLEESHYEVYGKWNYKRYHGAFFYEFVRLDTLYRKSFWNIPFGYFGDNFIIRMNYGLSVEWVPSLLLWSRHYFELGTLLRYKKVAIDLNLFGFTDENVDFSSIFYWMPSDDFRIYARAFLDKLLVGYLLLFSHIQIDFSTSLPGFGVSLGVNFNFNGFNFGGNHSFGHDDLDYNTFWITKVLKK